MAFGRTSSKMAKGLPLGSAPKVWHGPFGDLEKLPPAAAGGRAGVQRLGCCLEIGDFVDRHAARRGPVIGQQQQRTIAQARRGHLSAKVRELPNSLGAKLLAIEGQYALEAGRADVEEPKHAERFSHRGILSVMECASISARAAWATLPTGLTGPNRRTAM